MRFAIDTGGTFTDLLVEYDNGTVRMFKAPTTPEDPIAGVLAALTIAAQASGRSLSNMLAAGSALMYGTTHAINAIITKRTAKTAFLVTAGHPDILVLREGGRSEPFNYDVPFPDPLVPRSLTFEIDERIRPDGSILRPLDEQSCIRTLEKLKALKVEAVGVCLLWSPVNSAHERRLGELLEANLPAVSVTLSHKLNPTLREYRRASSTCIDASLKPMMQTYFASLEGRLREAGFKGRLLVVTSQGGLMDASEVARTPIHLINSGPSMAPVSGGLFASRDSGIKSVIVADTGGTTYDVSLVRNGETPYTRETWIGQPYRGHMTGFPSVDVKSVGAGGGSIAWLDDGKMLHVGPESAGADPGPVAYGRGGKKPTVTDAALVLGYIDPDYFLGGNMRLDVELARAAVKNNIADPLSLSVEEAAHAIIAVATENMVQAIVDITLNQGIDPSKAVLVGGGGAAGLNSVLIARRLQTPELLVPELGAALSAAGAIMSDIKAHHQMHYYTTSASFDRIGVNRIIDELRAAGRGFLEAAGIPPDRHQFTLKAEARYPEQVWEIEIAVPVERFDTSADVDALVQEFHRTHETIFAIKDESSGIEVINWSLLASAALSDRRIPPVDAGGDVRPFTQRTMYFPETGIVDAPVHHFTDMPVDQLIEGPAIVESSFTTVVINPGAIARRLGSGSLSIKPQESVEK